MQHPVMVPPSLRRGLTVVEFGRKSMVAMEAAHNRGERYERG